MTGHWTTYRQFRNVFNKVVRASKKHHYVNELKKNSRNPKKTWDTLKELTVGRTAQTSIDKIKVDNTTITDPFKWLMNLTNSLQKLVK